jgi:nitroreductase
VYERTTGEYGVRGIRYVHMEAGHAAQNVLLQAIALGLGGVVIGAFENQAVRRAAAMPANEQPLYIIPVGRP